MMETDRLYRCTDPGSKVKGNWPRNLKRTTRWWSMRIFPSLFPDPLQLPQLWLTPERKILLDLAGCQARIESETKGDFRVV